MALAFVCFKPKTSLAERDHDVYLMVWSPEDGKTRPLFDYVLPTGFGITYSFSPDGSRGMVATDSGILDKAYWLDRAGASEADLGLARARRPAWSPDGWSIVLFGNRQVPGEPGPQSVLIAHDLLLIPADCRNRQGGCAEAVQVLVKDVMAPSIAAWSPDGQWLAFGADLAGHGKGLYLRRMADGELIQVLTSGYWLSEWAPEGKRLVVRGLPPGGKPDDILRGDFGAALYILAVSSIVGE